MYKYVKASTEYAVYYTTADGRSERTMYAKTISERDRMLAELKKRNDIDYAVWYSSDDDEYGDVNIVIDKR